MSSLTYRSAQEWKPAQARAQDQSVDQDHTQQSTLGNAAMVQQTSIEDQASHGEVEDPAYLDQRDNELNAEAACNVTTMAMMLESLSDADTAKSAVIARLHELGETRDAATLQQMQLEDLLMTRFNKWSDSDWETCARAHPEHFHPGWYASASARSRDYYQIMESMTWALLELEDIVGDSQMLTNGGAVVMDGADYSLTLDEMLSAEHYQTVLGPGLAAGATVALGTDLTSGHIVMLAAVEDDGILVNDPYGLHRGRKSSYLSNGDAVYKGEKGDEETALEKQFTSERDNCRKRLRENNTAWLTLSMMFASVEMARLTSGAEAIGDLELTLPSNLGEQVFFSWEDVKNFKIGRWSIGVGPTQEPTA